MNRPPSRARLRGFTLVEVLMAIAIIAVGVGGVLLVFAVALTHSSDPQRQLQAVAIAEGYLDEILSRRYEDPDGIPQRESSRALYDDVTDYDGVQDSPPRDQDGVVLAGLEDYTVRVRVSSEIELGPAGQTTPARRIDVQVLAPPQVDTTLSAYKLP